MFTWIQEKYIRRIFDIGIIIKGIDGFFETITGVALFFIPADTLNNWLAKFTHHAGTLSPKTQTFTILFLLSHGLIKILIVAGLLRNKLWAYPIGIIVFGGFTIYQMIQYFQTYSMGLLVLSILDILVVWLTWHEYKIAKARVAQSTS